MKSHLDQLMKEQKLDSLIVMGNSDGNPVMNYLTGGAHLERALIVKRRGGPLTLIHGLMERDTAEETGLVLVDRDQKKYNRYELLDKHEGNYLNAEIDYLCQVVEDFELYGRCGVYGVMDGGAAFTLLNHLSDRLTNTELIGEFEESIFTLIRETKDDRELAELQEAGRRTCQIVGELQEFIQSHGVRNELVMRSDDEPLTIGHVKTFIRERCFAYGMTDHDQTIFSQGRDAGVPHNRGNPDMPLQLGQSIILDIFPQLSSGYYHDMTRTWSLGYATDEVLEAYEQTKEIFDQVMAHFKVGVSCRDLQLMACDYYEGKGHSTARSDPGTHEGYVHALGHGIGLDIHEDPRLTHSEGYTTVLQPGHVITVEPGLYYPSQGFGVRVEDAVALNEAGELIWLTDYPYDLVITMGG
ncbi:Xaa-Pro peptidase family protein [Chloroflexi bacterium TSY]|nr:Xaa-Pro peptidase family protein [Chloroflexi bacterium TSY]